MNFDEAKSWTRQTKGNKQAASEVSPIKVEEVPVDEVRVLEFVRAGAARGMLGMLARALSGRKGCGRVHVLDRWVGDLDTHTTQNAVFRTAVQTASSQNAGARSITYHHQVSPWVSNRAKSKIKVSVEVEKARAGAACSAGPGRPALVVVDHQDVV